MRRKSAVFGAVESRKLFIEWHLHFWSGQPWDGLICADMSLYEMSAVRNGSVQRFKGSKFNGSKLMECIGCGELVEVPRQTSCGGTQWSIIIP